MLILAPMVQVGCRSAASGVARAMSSRLASRNGPPEAVSTIRSTAPWLPSAIAWKIALCSESTGSSVAPASRTACSITSPAQTNASLLASATAPPRRIAASVLGNPAAPVIAAMVQSAGSVAACTTACGPAPAAVPVPARSRSNSGRPAGSAMTASSAPSRRACSASNLALRPPASATTRNRSGLASRRSTVLVPMLPVLPSTVTLRRSTATDIPPGSPARAAPRPGRLPAAHPNGRAIRRGPGSSVPSP